jgi:hypothetical protein
MPTNQVINFPVLPVKYEYTKFALEKKKKKRGREGKRESKCQWCINILALALSIWQEIEP